MRRKAIGAPVGLPSQHGSFARRTSPRSCTRTRCRASDRTRVKNLPDLALLATAQPLDAKRVRTALEQTFRFRKTHALPTSVPTPLAASHTPYQAMAAKTN